MANIIPTTLDHGSSTNTAGFSTNSITPVPNALILATLFEEGAHVSGESIAISGNGMTWVQVAASLVPIQNRMTTWRGMSGTPAPGAITFTPSGGTGSANYLWLIDQFEHVDISGANGAGAIVQSGTTTTNGTAGTMSVPLAAFSGPENITYGVMGRNATDGITKGGSFTELTNFTALGQEMQSQYALSNQTNINWSFGTASLDTNGFAAEIKPLPGGLLFASEI